MQLAYAERRAAGGPVEAGDAERAMHLMRALMPLAGWHRRLVRAFLALADGAEQLAFWQRHLDTRRFRIGLNLLMSRAMLRRVYAPPLLAALPERFAVVLRQRLERGFARHPNVENPYAQALLLGAKNQPLPEPVRTIRFVAGRRGILAAIGSGCVVRCVHPVEHPGRGILTYRERLSRAVRHAAADGAVVVLRSFAEPITAPGAATRPSWIGGCCGGSWTSGTRIRGDVEQRDRIVLTTVRVFGRAWQVARVVATRLVVPWVLRRKAARRVRSGCRRLSEEVGGLWIKLGQALALRFDILPADYCLQFFQLLNRIEPFSGADARAILEHELRRP